MRASYLVCSLGVEVDPEHPRTYRVLCDRGYIGCGGSPREGTLSAEEHSGGEKRDEIPARPQLCRGLEVRGGTL